VAFAKVNVDHVKDVAGKYGITAMPTFLFFKDGKVTSEGGVERIRGANVGELRAVVGRLAGKV
jgi:thioredoxin 1